MVTVLVLLSACGSAGRDRSDAQHQFERFGSSFDQWRAAAGAYGASLAIRLPDGSELNLASGIDSRFPPTPMPLDGTFQISSVSKTFVAAMVLDLASHGRLSLDDTVGRWLPELDGSNAITVRMLLNHTAGLGDWSQPVGPNFPDYVAAISLDLTRKFTPDEALAEHLRVGRVAAPGERFAYTDAGYLALARIVERVTGEDYAARLEGQFLRPFHLDSTWLNDGDRDGSRHGWLSLGGPTNNIDISTIPQQAIATTLWASAAMVSDSEDLLRWGNALYSGRVLGDEATQLFLDAPFTVTDAVTYGLGVEHYHFRHTLLGHTGRDGGTSVWLAYDQATGVTIALHANTDTVTYAQLDQLYDLIDQFVSSCSVDDCDHLSPRPAIMPPPGVNDRSSL